MKLVHLFVFFVTRSSRVICELVWFVS